MRGSVGAWRPLSRARREGEVEKGVEVWGEEVRRRGEGFERSGIAKAEERGRREGG